MSDEPNETPETPADETPKSTPKASKKKKSDPVAKEPETTLTPAETPAEASNEPTPVEPAAETPAPEPVETPATVQDELSNRTEEPAAESRNELVFDPSSGELVVKAKGDSVGSDAVIVSDIADEGFFAEGR